MTNLNPQFEEAAQKAYLLLQLYSPDKPPRFALGENVPNPEQNIRRALSEAQFVLNETSKASVRRRISTLNEVRKRQRIFNGLHLLFQHASAKLCAFSARL